MLFQVLDDGLKAVYMCSQNTHQLHLEGVLAKFKEIFLTGDINEKV